MLSSRFDEATQKEPFFWTNVQLLSVIDQDERERKLVDSELTTIGGCSPVFQENVSIVALIAPDHNLWADHCDGRFSNLPPIWLTEEGLSGILQLPCRWEVVLPPWVASRFWRNFWIRWLGCSCNRTDLRRRRCHWRALWTGEDYPKKHFLHLQCPMLGPGLDRRVCWIVWLERPSHRIFHSASGKRIFAGFSAYWGCSEERLTGMDLIAIEVSFIQKSRFPPPFFGLSNFSLE